MILKSLSFQLLTARGRIGLIGLIAPSYGVQACKHEEEKSKFNLPMVAKNAMVTSKMLKYAT